MELIKNRSDISDIITNNKSLVFTKKKKTFIKNNSIYIIQLFIFCYKRIC